MLSSTGQSVWPNSLLLTFCIACKHSMHAANHVLPDSHKTCDEALTSIARELLMGSEAMQAGGVLEAHGRMWSASLVSRL